MARKPNYDFERKERERQKAAKVAEKAAEKAAKRATSDGDQPSEDTED